MINFKIVNREKKFQGKVFEVQKVQVHLPDGREVKYDLVVPRNAVTIVPVEDGLIWFVRQYRLGADQVLLELPAGVIEDGESPEVCAAREIREEIGMAAKELTRIGELYLSPGYSTEFHYHFLARGLSPDALQADLDEFLEVEKISIAKTYEMVRQGKIKDGKTLAALFLAQGILLPDAG
ncbi:MAG: NUDIX hydrolase [Anaerolineaceae bacterium]|nr:NUDIX hydrolase [Anaerolineaceae bacterium]